MMGAAGEAPRTAGGPRGRDERARRRRVLGSAGGRGPVKGRRRGTGWDDVTCEPVTDMTQRASEISSADNI